MASIKIRHLVEKPGRTGSRYFWQPSAKLRGGGWRPVRLDASDVTTAANQAQAVNAALDLWRGGKTVPADHAHLAVVLAVAPVGVVDGDDRKPGGKLLAATRPGTLADLIRVYRASEEWRELRVNTRKSYEDNLRALESWGGDAPLSILTPERFKTLWRSMRAKTPSKARAVIVMARALFSFARCSAGYRGYVQDGVLVNDNPAAKLGLKTKRLERTEADIWSPEEVAIFAAIADQLGWHSIGTAVTLNAWLGQREGDVIGLPANRYRQGAIEVGQSKTGARVSLPVDLVPELQSRIEEERLNQKGKNVQGLTLLVSERDGLTWNEHSFRRAFADIRKAATPWCPSLAKKQFMLLRHTAVVRLAEAGCTAEEISTITGHSLATVNYILERYLVRTKRMAETAFRKRLAILAD